MRGQIGGGGGFFPSHPSRRRLRSSQLWPNLQEGSKQEFLFWFPRQGADQRVKLFLFASTCDVPPPKRILLPQLRVESCLRWREWKEWRHI